MYYGNRLKVLKFDGDKNSSHWIRQKMKAGRFSRPAFSVLLVQFIIQLLNVL